MGLAFYVVDFLDVRQPKYLQPCRNTFHHFSPPALMVEPLGFLGRRSRLQLGGGNNGLVGRYCPSCCPSLQVVIGWMCGTTVTQDPAADWMVRGGVGHVGT